MNERLCADGISVVALFVCWLDAFQFEMVFQFETLSRMNIAATRVRFVWRMILILERTE